jgi:hypothetical protein
MLGTISHLLKDFRSQPSIATADLIMPFTQPVATLSSNPKNWVKHSRTGKLLLRRDPDSRWDIFYDDQLHLFSILKITIGRFIKEGGKLEKSSLRAHQARNFIADFIPFSIEPSPDCLFINGTFIYRNISINALLTRSASCSFPSPDRTIFLGTSPELFHICWIFAILFRSLPLSLRASSK